MSVSGERGEETGWRILIAGTGGQGVLTAARLLCDAFVERGHDVVSGQLHGMAQRGGSVQSSVIIDGGISPVIPTGHADFVLGFEPVETARALPLMGSHTVVYMNTAPIIPFVLGQRFVLKQGKAEYPEVVDLAASIAAVTVHLCVLDATSLAARSGSAKAVNMVMLGCLLGSGLLPVRCDEFWESVAQQMPTRFAAVNGEAFSRGAAIGRRDDVGENRP